VLDAALKESRFRRSSPLKLAEARRLTNERPSRRDRPDWLSNTYANLNPRRARSLMSAVAPNLKIMTKLVAAGNDFLFVESVAGITSRLTREEIVKVCDRHFGIGADGLVSCSHRANL
jgi:hypothetical protein